MIRKLTDKQIEDLTTLALLVGRFDKMQIHDIERSDDSIMEFQFKDWDQSRPYRKKIGFLEESLPSARTYASSMDTIIERQESYRRSHGLPTYEEAKEQHNRR